MDFQQIRPKPTERAFLCGMTGSGKSYLARYLLAFYPSALVFDAKDEIRWSGYQRFSKLKKLISAKPRRAIYAPNIHELDDRKYHDAFFKYAYLRGNTAILCDEVLAVADGNDLPFYYKAALTRGRSKGVVVLSATQRPVSIPQWIISESENKYIFYLEMPQDRDRIYRVKGIPEELTQSLDRDNHEFVYANLRYTSGKLKLKV